MSISHLDLPNGDRSSNRFVLVPPSDANPSWSYDVCRLGVAPERIALTSQVRGGLVTSRMEAVPLFAAAILRDLLGPSRVAIPVFSRMLPALIDSISRAGSAEVSLPRSRLIGYVRQHSPDMPAAFAASLAFGYRATALRDRSRLEMVTESKVVPFAAVARLGWGHQGRQVDAFASTLLNIVEQQMGEFLAAPKGLARLCGTRFATDVLGGYDSSARSIFIPAAEIIGYLLDEFPQLFTATATKDHNAAKPTGVLDQVERATLGAVREHSERVGAMHTIGAGWASPSSGTKYEVLAIPEAATGTVTFYAVENAPGNLGLTSGDVGMRPSAPVLVLGRASLDFIAVEGSVRTPDLRWLEPLVKRANIDELVSELESREVPTPARRAAWNDRCPYPYGSDFASFSRSRFQLDPRVFAVKIGEWTDSRGVPYEVNWSNAEGYLYANRRTQIASDESPEVVVLGRFRSRGLFEEVVGNALVPQLERGGLERLAAEVRGHLLDKQSPHYAYGLSSPTNGGEHSSLAGGLE